MKKFFMLAMLIVTSTPSFAGKPADVTVTKAWVRVQPPAVKITGAFMVIKNSSKKAIRLTKVSTPASKFAEIHKSSMADGIMHMEKIPHIEIPAGKDVQLAPGGYHLMLIQTIKPIIEGQEVPLTLHFSDGSMMKISAKGSKK